jgi:hypothetical protein
MRLGSWCIALAIAGCAQAPTVTSFPDAGKTHDAGDARPPVCGGYNQVCCGITCQGSLACLGGVCEVNGPSPDGSADGGDCPFVFCHGLCTDVESDSTNCGICGHDCAGTLCATGLCLARGIAVGTSPVDLVVDSTNVYFTDGDGTVKKVLAGGGTVGLLAVGVATPYGITVDASNVYFTSSGTFAAGFNDGAVLKVPISPDGGTAIPTPIATNRPSPQAIVVDDTQVYWLEPGSMPTNGSILSCPLSGCPSNTPHVMVDTLALPYGLALDSTSLYVTASGGGEVYGVDKVTAKIRIIALSQNQPEGIAVANGQVYWATNLDGLIQSAPVGGSGGTTKFIATTMGSPQSVAADSTKVYWSDTHPVFTFGPLEECSVTGCPPAAPLKLVEMGETATNIAIDSTYVYWIDASGQILRVAK